MADARSRSSRPPGPDEYGFPYFRLTGTHRQIGRSYGQAASSLIHRHLALALERLQTHRQINAAAAFEAAASYREFVQTHARFLDEEILGVAEGAGLSIEQAYLLQLRAEVAASARRSVAPPLAAAGDPNECSSFVACGRAARDGVLIVGHNADLPALYREISIVLKIVPDDGPAVLMVTPAGQVSYIGMNERGLVVVGNYLFCGAWRTGFPRYLLSRAALQHDRVADAVEMIAALPRASSRNLLIADPDQAIDLETTPLAIGTVAPTDGVLVHTNHFLSPEQSHVEQASQAYLRNSHARFERVHRLLSNRRGQLDVAAARQILRDRECHPDAISREDGDVVGSDVITFASMIAVPERKELWIAAGPPSQQPYIQYAFGEEGYAVS